MTSRLILSVFCIWAISATAECRDARGTRRLDVYPGELIFSDDFDPETVSDRW